LFAVKCIDRAKVRGNEGWKCLKNEVAIMADIRNEYVVQLMDGTKTQSTIYLSLELCNGGDLDGLRKARGLYLPEIEARVIL
jgi:serine/threonine protein kinase